MDRHIELERIRVIMIKTIDNNRERESKEERIRMSKREGQRIGMRERQRERESKRE